MAVENVKELIRQKIKEVNPGIATHEGTAVSDAMIKPGRFFLEPLDQAVDEVNESLSTDNYETMPLDELKALMANFFSTYIDGTKTTGTLKIFVSAPQNTAITESSIFRRDEDTFKPIVSRNFSAADININFEDPYYFFSVPVIAEESGEISVSAGDTFESLATIPNIVKIEASADFTAGAAGETNEEFLERTKEQISVRDLLTKRGVQATLFERERDNFAYIQEVRTVGYRDPEMLRDIVQSTEGPVHVGGKVDLYAKTTFNKISATVNGFSDSILVKPLTKINIFVGGSETNSTSEFVTFTVSPYENSPGTLQWDVGEGKYKISRTPFMAGDNELIFNTLFTSQFEGIGIIEDTFQEILEISDSDGDFVYSTHDFGFDGSTNINCYLFENKRSGTLHTLYSVYQKDELRVPPYMELQGSIENVFIANGSGNDYDWGYPTENAFTDVPIFRITRAVILDPISLEEEEVIFPNTYVVEPIIPELRFSTAEEAIIVFILSYHGPTGTEYLNHEGGFANILDYDDGADEWKIDKIPLRIHDEAYDDDILFSPNDLSLAISIDTNEKLIDFSSFCLTEDPYPDTSFTNPVNAFLVTDDSGNKLTVYTMSDYADIILPVGYEIISYIPGVFSGTGAKYDWNIKNTMDGLTIKFEYDQPLLEELQEFIESDDERIVNGDYLAKSFAPVFAWVDFNFFGDKTVSEVTSIVTDYINNLGSGVSLSVSEFVSHLISQDVNLNLPVQIFSQEYDFRGDYNFRKSGEIIESGRTSYFVALEEFYSINKVSI